MKNMLKKCISLVMVIFIMSASFAVFAAEETEAPSVAVTYTEAQIEKYNKDLAFLKAVGIWTSTGTDPVNKVTRAEFATALAGLCNLDKAANIPLTYSDVNAETQYVDSIYAVGVANLMVGSDNMFRPEEEITFNQAAKAVVTALGYDGIANSKGGYPDGFYSTALQLDLTVGAGRDSALTRYDVVELMTKACETDVMQVIGVESEDVIFSVSEGKTVLEVYHNITKVEAQLKDDGLTNIKGESQAPGNNVIVGELKLKNDSVVTDGLLGYNVIAYYNTDEDELLYIEEDVKKNTILTVKAEDLQTDSAKFTKKNVVYNNGNKTVNVEVSPYADFIYNGSSYPAFMVNDLKIKSGTLTFVDVNFDKSYDVVIAEEFENFLLLTNNQVNQIIADKNGNEIKYGDYKKFEFFTTNGETKAISLLKANSVLSVFASKDDARIKIIVSEDKVDCKVKAIETDEDGKEIITVTHMVEGVEVDTPYKYSATFLENNENGVDGFVKPVIGSEVTLRLDYQGRIAGIENYNDQYQYAYFITAGKDTTSKLASKCLVKMCLNTGDIATIATAKKIMINGVTTENGADILSETDLYVDGNISGDFRRQVVKVKLSAIGELKEIETTTDAEICTKTTGFDPTRFCLVYKTPTGSYSEYYNAKRNSLSGKYTMDADTTIFLVPTDDDFDEKYIKVIPHEDLYNLARRSDARMYDADQYWTVGAVEVISQKGTGFLPKAMTVIKSVKGVNADGEDIYMVTGRYKDEEYTFREEHPGIIDSVVPGGLKFGDIAAIKVDENYNIVDLNLRVRTSDSAPFQSITGNEDTGEGYFYGHVYARNNIAVVLSTDRGATVRAHAIANGPKPVVIDYVNHEVRQGTYDDVPVSASLDENGNYTFTDNGVTMYIYRYSGYINDCVVVIK